MDADSPTLASRRRPSRGRRRSARSFSPSSSSLEPRALLTALGPAVKFLGAPAFAIGPARTLSPRPTMITVNVGGYGTWSPPGPPNKAPSVPGGVVGSVPAMPGGVVGSVPAMPASPPSNVGPSPSPDDRARMTVGLAEADIRVNGVLTPEFAISDPSRGVVLVKVGFEAAPSNILTAADGINSPGSVTLKDLNADGLPDLIVANTGADNVLVFPGLVGGGVGQELNRGQGFAVGKAPVSLSVGDFNGDGIPDLIVANKASDNVSLLMGREAGTSWAASLAGVLGAGRAPVRTVLQDIDADGRPELFILNSGSNDVTFYRGGVGGVFQVSAAGPIPVGLDPIEMFVGRFDRRPGLDLITVNTGSHNISFVTGVGTVDQGTTTYNSGGIQPDAAFASDLNHDGVLDLVVSNGGDGQLALLQGGRLGLHLVGVIDRSGFAAPTALVPGGSGNGRSTFFAASAGDDVDQILRFDLGPASDFLSVPLETLSRFDDAQIELDSQLVPFGNSGLDLIAVFWDGGRPSRIKTPDLDDRVASSPIPCVKTGGPDEEGEEGLAETSHDLAPPPPSPDDPDAWIRYVLGIDLALGEPRDLLGARDDEGDVPAPEIRAELRASSPVDPELDAATSAVDEALRSLRSDAAGPSDFRLRPAPERKGLDGDDAPAERLGLGSAPVIASSVLLACRLIFRASTPRPPSIRPGAGRRLVETWPRPARPIRL